MEDREYLKTSNLNLAATLLSIGFPIDGIYVKENSKIFDFYFIKSKEVKKAMDDFWKRELRVEPQELFGARNEIVTRMKDEESSKKYNKTAR